MKRVILSVATIKTLTFGAAALAAWSCAAPLGSDEAGDDDLGSGGADSGSSASGGATTLTSGSGGADEASGGSASSGGTPASGAGGGPVAMPVELKFPLAVDDFFAPSGFMGDILFTTMTNDCDERRPVTAGVGGASPGSEEPMGSCHVVDYAWNATTPAGWAAVKWQSPSNNWGEQKGLAMPQGASTLSFFAKGEAGGEVITFSAGGINTNGAVGPGIDTFDVSTVVTLTTDWTYYEIDVSPAVYTQVVGGFGWANGGGAPIRFNIDDIRWQ